MNTNIITMQSFVSIRKSQQSGGYYFRLFKDGVAYQAHSEDSAAVLLSATGALNKSNLVQVKRTRSNGEEWMDLQIKYPLNLEIRVDGDANGAKFCTIMSATRVKPMQLSVNLDGVETRVPQYGAKRAAVAEEQAEEDAPGAL